MILFFIFALPLLLTVFKNLHKMKVLFDYCFDEEDVHFIKLVLNYCLEFTPESMYGFSGRITKILNQFEDQEWLFDCLPDSDDGNRVLDFCFSKDELHVIALCADHYRALSDQYALEVKCHVLTALLWTFFD